ncbi:divisome protein SepX/GlpR [Flindersiella endophytica]
MGTGLIYAAIVAAWAAYLVPLWLRRHDEAAASRSVDRFSQAMRVLERRRPTAGVVSDDTDGTSASASSDEDDAEPLTSPATRRRRTLVVLLAASTVLTVLVVLGLLSRWTLAAPCGVIALFLVASARAARVEQERARLAWQRLRERAAALAELEAAEAAAAAAANPEPVFAVLPEEDYPRHREDESDKWVPRDVPLPTYLEKARAPRTVRTVELGRTGEDRPVESTETVLDESGRAAPSAEPSTADDPAAEAQQRAVGD